MHRPELLHPILIYLIKICLSFVFQDTQPWWSGRKMPITLSKFSSRHHSGTTQLIPKCNHNLYPRKISIAPFFPVAIFPLSLAQECVPDGPPLALLMEIHEKTEDMSLSEDSRFQTIFLWKYLNHENVSIVLVYLFK